MGIHYDYKSKRGERAMLKEAKRKESTLVAIPVLMRVHSCTLLQYGTSNSCSDDTHSKEWHSPAAYPSGFCLLAVKNSPFKRSIKPLFILLPPLK